MAYDHALAARVRDTLGDDPEITEREMFGGIAFLHGGRMAVGVSKNELMVRVDPDDQAEATAMTGVRPFDMSGRPMRGWILVAQEAIEDDESLRRWVGMGIDYATGLPPT